jgi:tripartite-type tricarboxylate transporter receptor subunit TctC
MAIRVPGNLRRVVAALLLLAMPTLATAADYPLRPVTLVVGFPPGGPSDTLARVLANRLSVLLGQPFVVDNRPGAGGNVAGAFVAHAEPDGYTLLVANNAILATNASLYARLDYDPVKDFAPVTLIGTQANILVVNPELPVRSVSDLIALARANPGKLNFASSGYGLAAHLAGELFKTEAKIDIVHVPYKGAAPALQDLISGQDQIMFATTTAVTGFIKSGQVRPLAVTTLKRTALLPDLPTLDELGLQGFDATTWHGLVAPAGTPKFVIDTLHDAVMAALRDPALRASLEAQGIDVVGDTPEAFAAYIKTEIPKWKAIIEASGAKLQ